jgi:hypothetical protein
MWLSIVPPPAFGTFSSRAPNFTVPVAYQWGLSTDLPIAGDYDGDGKTDIAVYRPGTGVWYILKSSTNFTVPAVYQWGISTDIPVPKSGYQN